MSLKSMCMCRTIHVLIGTEIAGRFSPFENISNDMSKHVSPD